jgi:hypothetical protein
MIEYIKNIIPRVKKYSQELDKIENFIDKRWIFIDDNGDHHQYLFLRDKRLIMTLGATTKEGSWELLPTDQLLIKRGTNDLVLLENMFVEQALLVLKRSTTEDVPFVLINQQLIPDLDAVKYLKEFEEEQLEKEKEKIKPLPSPQYYKVLESGELFGPEFLVGKKIKTEDNIILNGTYKTAHVSYEKYVVINNNIITEMYFHVHYFYKQNDLIIQTDNMSKLLGKPIINASSLNIPTKRWITIQTKEGNKFLVKINSGYKIKWAFIGGLQLILNIIYLIFTFAVIFTIIYGLISSK